MMANTSRYLKMQKSENVKNGQIGPFSFVATIYQEGKPDTTSRLTTYSSSLRGLIM